MKGGGHNQGFGIVKMHSGLSLSLGVKDLGFRFSHVKICLVVLYAQVIIWS